MGESIGSRPLRWRLVDTFLIAGFAASGAGVVGSGVMATAACTPVLSAVAAPLLTSVVLAGGTLVAYESVASLVVEREILDISGRWEFIDVDPEEEKVYDPTDFTKAIIEFQRVAGGGFVVASGPKELRGQRLKPHLDSDDDVLATASYKRLTSCVDSRTGDLIAEDVFENRIRWVFKEVEFPVEGVSRRDQLAFRYVDEGTKVSEEGAARNCPPRTRFSVTAKLRRLVDE